MPRDIAAMMEPISRRRLLTLALAGVAPAVLPACAGSQSPATATPPAVGSTPPTPVPTPTAPLATATPAPTATPRPPDPLLVNPQFRLQNTPTTTSLGPDGYTWAQGQPLIVDKHGHLLAIAQKGGGAGHYFVYSNDAGATWQEGTLNIAGMVRASLAYDDGNDILHALWRGQNEGDGVFYRRYTPGRDGNNRLTGVTADATGDIRLDGQGDGAMMRYEHPIIHWLSGAEMGNRHGAVLCVWSARNDQGGVAGNEVRASLRLLENTAADAAAAGWGAPGPPAASTIGNAPAVAYTTLAANKAADSIYPSLGRKRARGHIGDLYLFYADGGGDGGAHWRWRRFPWDGAARRWGGGTPEVPIAPIRRAGNDAGYNLKQQLGTKVVEDATNDRVYFGFSTWKDDAAGDTWNFAYVDGRDTLSPIVDVYSCGGRFQPELYALTGDLAFDDRYGRLVVAYIHSGVGANHGYLRVYDGTTATEPETRFFAAADVDIPLLWQDPRTGRCRYGGGAAQQLLVLFRDTVNQAPPYRGWFGTLDWSGG